MCAKSITPAYFVTGPLNSSGAGERRVSGALGRQFDQFPAWWIFRVTDFIHRIRFIGLGFLRDLGAFYCYRVPRCDE